MDYFYKIPGISYLARNGYLFPLLWILGIALFLRYAFRYAQARGWTKIASDRLVQTFWPPEKEAARLEAKGELEQAAMLFRRIDFLGDAVRCYQKMEDPIQAGQLLVTMERFDEAERMFAAAGATEELQGLWSRQGRWDRIADAYMSQGKTSLAAEAFEKSGDPARAAEIQLQGENFEKAGELYEKAELASQAAQAFEKAYERDKIFMKENHGLALRSAELYRNAGKHEEAGRMFVEADLLEDAARAFETAGRHKEAAEQYYRVRDYHRAAESFEAAGDKIRSATVRAEQLEGEGDAAGAAALYRTGGDVIKAAELFEASGQDREAACCYRENGEFLSAAECFARAGDAADAAAAFQKAGRFDRASELYLDAGEFDQAVDMLERANRPYDAAMILSQLGRTGSAIHLLKRVLPADERFREANYLLGRLLKKTGLMEEAATAYRNALAGDGPSSGTLDAHYQLATTLSEMQKDEEARNIFQQILAIRPDFRDVRTRINGTTRPNL